jgi:hypothetical protein
MARRGVLRREAMPILHVLVNDKGDVLGTWQASHRAGESGPEQVMLVAGPRQKVVQVEIDDDVARLDPTALHNRIKKDHIKKGRKK